MARVPVAVNGGPNAIAVAEHAVMLMMATLRQVTEFSAMPGRSAVPAGGVWGLRRGGASGSTWPAGS